ncbi:hypothetical protein K8Q94_02495 [Candidatus Nomurabacteria bacterium]|nr:hypothetical protein [Candidatus Nomurabacteria bacterium]
MIFKIKQNNMDYVKKFKKNNGFVLLFAILLSSMIMAIALGVSNIALKELKFSISAKDTNDAFLSADTGIECALYLDRSLFDINGTQKSAFGESGTLIPAPGCANISGFDFSSNTGSWNFALTNLGSSGKSCVNINVSKNQSTIIDAYGYNTDSILNDNLCTPGYNAVERELEVTY